MARFSVRFEVLFVLVVLEHERRRIRHFGIIAHPTAAWTAQQLAETFPRETAPRYLLRDRDGVHGSEVRERGQSMGIEEVLTAPRCSGPGPRPRCSRACAPGPASLAGWCYSGAPASTRGVAAAVLGRARFREFGLASLVALGMVLVAADAVGLMVALAAAFTTVGLRVYAHRRLGGLTGRCLLATRELGETVVPTVLALLPQPSG